METKDKRVLDAVELRAKAREIGSLLFHSALKGRIDYLNALIMAYEEGYRAKEREAKKQ